MTCKMSVSKTKYYYYYSLRSYLLSQQNHNYAEIPGNQYCLPAPIFALAENDKHVAKLRQPRTDGGTELRSLAAARTEMED